MKDLMTVKEVADYLRLKERKVYDLVASGDIPCTRATGKWLFPKHLVDMWLARSSTFPKIAAGHLTPPPPIIVGSHDPLLEWAVRESRCGLAMMPGGSLDGLQRFARGEAAACGMHVLDLVDGGFNVSHVSEVTVGIDCILMEWAWREQGLLVLKGNPMRINSIREAAAIRARFVVREPQAGSYVLFRHLVSEAGVDIETLNVADVEARSETDVGLAVIEGRADAGLGVRAVAHQLGLDFVPLHRERYDLLIRRRDYFENAIQQLMRFIESDTFKERAAVIEGYDVSHVGRIHFNAP